MRDYDCRSLFTHALLALLLTLMLSLLAGTMPVAAEGGTSVQLHLPVLIDGKTRTLNCAVGGATYGQLSVNAWQPPDSSRPAAAHADLNLALRGYAETQATLGLVDYGGATDSAAPQLYGLFADNRTPTFRKVYQVYQWDWECNCRSNSFEPALAEWPVTFIGMATTRGEPIHVPDRSGGQLSPEGYKVLVLYASGTRLTLKYTREDNVLEGYTIHIEGICVDPALLSHYRSSDSAGRLTLPALFGRQQLGVATGQEIGIAIRDRGYWMDPRSRKDWWYGRARIGLADKR